MPLIDKGRLLRGAVPVNNENVNPVWRGNIVLDDGGRAVAFVKMLSKRDLAVECLCAVIGREFGLPIPRPFLVTVQPDTLKGITLIKEEVLFGSERSASPDLAEHLSDETGIEVMAELYRWRKSFDLGIFDDWMANPDRHPRNLLYDGESKFTPIDHSHAIPRGIEAGQILNNRILDALHGLSKEIGKPVKDQATRGRKSAKKITATNPLLKVAADLERELDEYHNPAEMIAFLQERIGYLGGFVDTRYFSPKQQDLVNNVSSKPESTDA